MVRTLDSSDRLKVVHYPDFTLHHDTWTYAWAGKKEEKNQENKIWPNLFFNAKIVLLFYIKMFFCFCFQYSVLQLVVACA